MTRYHCNRPGCPEHVRADGPVPPEWITVAALGPEIGNLLGRLDGGPGPFHFCSLRCLGDWTSWIARRIRLFDGPAAAGC